MNQRGKEEAGEASGSLGHDANRSKAGEEGSLYGT